MNSTGTDFSGTKTDKDLGVWKRRLDDARNRSKAKKEHLL